MHEVGLTAGAERRKAGSAAHSGPSLGCGRALLGCALLVGLGAARRVAGQGAPLLGTASAFVQAAWPLWHRQQVEPGDVVYHSFGAQWRAELRDGALLAALVLPPWICAASWWFGLGGGLAISAGGVGRAAATFAGQWLTVAGPEEWFWRGYVQSALVAWDQRRRSLGAPAVASKGPAPAAPLPWQRCLPRGAVVTAALFALAHLVRQPPGAALATFVPGLLLAALYARRGRVLGASLLHAACNTASALLLG